MWVKKMPVPWIKENVKVVAQLSRTDAWNKHIQKKDNMYIVREGDKIC